MLIGITGTDGSGKGTAVTYFIDKHGFTHYSARAILMHELSRRNIDPTRANMRLIANEMREQYGSDYMVVHNLEKIKVDGIDNAIIESIRTIAEAETLKRNGGILIAIDADQTLRYERVQARRSETDKVTYEEFVAHEALESNDPNPYGMQKQKVIEMADYLILNNGTTKDLYTTLETLILDIKTK